MKFSYLKATLAAAALLGSISAANAGLISGAHTTIGGKDVALQGYEWMSLDHTAGLSRATIENVNGFTDRYGTKWNAGDWVYASRTQTEVLMNSIWGGTYDGWANESVDGSKWFLENFGELNHDMWEGTTRKDEHSTEYGGDFASWFLFGNEMECTTYENKSCIGHVRYVMNSTASSAFNVHTGEREIITSGGLPMALVEDRSGYNTGISYQNHIASVDYSRKKVGSLLIKAADVPEPSTLAIFALGMIGLASRRFKKKS